jgi:peroxiredoxin
MLRTIAWPRGTSAVMLFAVLVATALAAPAPARAQVKTPPPTGSNPGDTRSSRSSTSPPQATALGRFLVGDPAPEVRLTDHVGRTFQLSVERKAKPWLLVFIRRIDELTGVESIGDDLVALGIGSVVIAPFGREKVLERVDRPRLPILFDRASVTARTYGVYDPVTGNPRPGAFLVDRRGRIVWLISGGLPTGTELVRMTREALEAYETGTVEGTAN